VLRSSVINAAGRELMRNSKSKPRQYNSTVEVGSVNLTAVPGGSYRLRIGVVDTTKTPETVLAFSEKKFFVYRPDRAGDTTMPAGAEGNAAGEFSFMTEEEVDMAFRYAQYIVTAQEQKQYEQLTDLKAKRNFLAQFWRQRDPDPSTFENEAKTSYYERVEYANKNFSMREFKSSSTRYMDGWKTDRGRVYIMYGKYSDIEREPNSSEYLPYEVWTYEGIQGGVVFAFVDRKGTGDYTLVHSSHRNELSHENWKQDYAQRVE
jgi:GWxTD domain-containing protein